MLFQYWSIVAPFAWQVHLACRWKAGGAHQILLASFRVVCGTDCCERQLHIRICFLVQQQSGVRDNCTTAHMWQAGRQRQRQAAVDERRPTSRAMSKFAAQHHPSHQHIFTPHDCFLLNIAKMPSMPFLTETKVIEVCCAAGGEFTTGPFTLQVPFSLALARLCNSRRRKENQFPLLFFGNQGAGQAEWEKDFLLCSP